jgi:hypothetical protein
MGKDQPPEGEGEVEKLPPHEREGNRYSPPPSRGRLGGGWEFPEKVKLCLLN